MPASQPDPLTATYYIVSMAGGLKRKQRIAAAGPNKAYPLPATLVTSSARDRTT